ncbi:MAG: GNAT family protein [Phycisphaerales bacterium]
MSLLNAGAAPRERPGAYLPAATFDPQPTLVSDLVTLGPLRSNDWDALFGVVSDPEIWTQHPEADRRRQCIFRGFFVQALAEGALAIVENSTGEIIGSTRFHAGADPSEIEIGWTFLARRCWDGRDNAQVKRLVLGHAFREFGRVVFIVGPENFRSQAAVARLGARPDGEITEPDREGRPARRLRFVITRPAAM